MLNRKLLIPAAALTLLVGTAIACYATSKDLDAVRDQLKKDLPALTIDGVRKSDVEGLYEITAGTNILYYSPAAKRIIFGEVYTLTGESITADHRQQLVAKKYESLDLSKAVKIGSGSKRVVIFTDPDCPYCRRADQYLAGKSDLTVYVFFSPLTMHPHAEEKAAYILGAKDPAAAYRDTMAGKYDETVPKASEEALAKVKEHKALAASFGVKGTPVFYINGKVITGADFKAIDSSLEATAVSGKTS